MSNIVFELFAKLGLDSSEFDNGLTNAESKASGIGKALGSAAKVGAAAITAASGAVMAFGASSVNAGAEFDKSMSQVAATMGVTVDEIGNLRDFAQQMGSTTAFSATQAADALNYMALAGYDAETSMEMLPNVLNLAAAGGMELATASDMVTDAQSALGLSLEETTTMVDQMAKASSKSNTSVAQLGEAILTIGATARNVAGGTTELSTVLGALADNGIKGAEGGTHLRNMILSLQNPTDDAAETLNALGIAVYDADGNMRSMVDIIGDLQTATDGMDQASKDAITSGIFNKTDLAAVNALLNTSQDRFDELTTAIDGSKGAAQAMAETQLDNLTGDITLFQSALEGAQIAISDGITPSLREFVQFGTDALSDLTEAFKSNGVSGAMDGLAKVFSDGLGRLVQGLPEVVDLGVQLIKAIGKGFVDNLPTLGDAFLEVTATLGQVGLDIMQSIADGMSGFDFGQSVQNIIDYLSEAFSSDGIEQFASLGIEILGNIGRGITEALPVLAESAIELMTSLGTYLQEQIPLLLPTALQALMEFSGSLRENVSELVNAGLDMILAIADGLIQALPAMIQTIPTIITNIAGIINDNAPKLIVAGIELIGKLIVGIVQAIPTLIAEFPKILLAIISVITAVNWVNLGSTIIKGIINGVKSLAAELPTMMQNMGQRMVVFLKSINWANLGSSIITMIGNGVRSLISLIPTLLKSIGSTAINVFKSINWLEVGTFLVQGIWNGISSATGWILDKLSGWVDGIVGGIKGFFGIESPSKVMRDQVGVYVGEGVAVGIEKSLPTIEDAMGDLTDIATQPITANYTGVTTKSESGFDYEAMANAVLYAFEKSNLTVEMDNREFGRIVRKVVSV